PIPFRNNGGDVTVPKSRIAKSLERFLEACPVRKYCISHEVICHVPLLPMRPTTLVVLTPPRVLHVRGAAVRSRMRRRVLTNVVIASSIKRMTRSKGKTVVDRCLFTIEVSRRAGCFVFRTAVRAGLFQPPVALWAGCSPT